MPEHSRDFSTALGMTFMDDRARLTLRKCSGIRHTIMKCKFPLCVLVIMTALSVKAQSKPSATLIVTNAAIYTEDKHQPKAEAVAVIGDLIVGVGSRPPLALGRGR